MSNSTVTVPTITIDSAKMTAYCARESLVSAWEWSENGEVLYEWLEGARECGALIEPEDYRMWIATFGDNPWVFLNTPHTLSDVPVLATPDTYPQKYVSEPDCIKGWVFEANKLIADATRLLAVKEGK